MSCSDQNMDIVIELAKYAQAIGADSIVVHAPVLHFLKAQDETLYEYYKYISEQVDIGIALWSHPDSGYLMSPELCARIADIPERRRHQVFSVPREMYAKLTRLAGDRLIVCTASEEEWFDNIVELGWRLYLCSSPPYLVADQASTGACANTPISPSPAASMRRARSATASTRCATRSSRRTPKEKPQAHSKYWQDLLGQGGGTVRRPMLALTDAERDSIRTAFDACGLRLASASASSAA